MHTIVFKGHEQLAKDIGLIPLIWEQFQFPDHESHIRIISPVPKEVAILCSLHHPDYKIFPLIAVAQTLRRLGAERIILTAPYLCYMRQDKEFNIGDAISSHIFGQLISQYVDHLITIDPHLHRIKSLDEILTISNTVLHANGLLADYIKTHIVNPLIVGPDAESIQWVRCIAEQLNAPYVIAQKTRTGDKNVSITIEDLSPYTGCHVVLVDDVISSGQTIYKAAKATEHPNLTILAVHAVFADNAYDLLRSITPNIITVNTIPHITNGIDLALMLKELTTDKRIQP